MVESGIKLTVVDGVVCVSGEIDMNSAKSLDRALAAVEPPTMIDMREISFMDSSGLNVLLAHYRRLAEQGDAIRVVAMSRAVERVLEVTGLLRTLTDDSTRLVRGPPLLEIPIGASRGVGAGGGGAADGARRGVSSGSSPLGWR